MRLATLRPFIASAAFLTLATASAQYAWDIGFHVGGANYLGEMGGKDQPRRDFIWDMKLSQSRLAFGGFARRKLNRMLSMSTGIVYLRLQGADALTESYGPRRGRNLNFRNDLIEWYIRPEITIFQDNDVGGRGSYKTDFRLFGFVGAGVFYHSPKGQLNREGQFYNLRDYNTELANYSSIGASIPAGIGLHFTKKRRHRYGFEINWRTTFTDYLDDVSTTYKDPELLPGGPTGTAAQLANQNIYLPLSDEYPLSENYGWGTNQDNGQPENIRGDPTHNDSYLTMTFTYSYVLRGQSNFYRQRFSWIRGTKRVGRKSRAKF